MQSRTKETSTARPAKAAERQHIPSTFLFRSDDRRREEESMSSIRHGQYDNIMVLVVMNGSCSFQQSVKK